MIEKMGESNPLVRLMRKYQKGTRPIVHMGPFLPLVHIKERGLSFSDIMRDSQAMTEAALMSFEFGFESTVLPFDLTVEAEMLGAGVRHRKSQGADTRRNAAFRGMRRRRRLPIRSIAA
jgi:uroporphyrinogen-III decarboxylase